MHQSSHAWMPYPTPILQQPSFLWGATLGGGWLQGLEGVRPVPSSNDKWWMGMEYLSFHRSNKHSPYFLHFSHPQPELAGGTFFLRPQSSCEMAFSFSWWPSCCFFLCCREKKFALLISGKLCRNFCNLQGSSRSISPHIEIKPPD